MEPVGLTLAVIGLSGLFSTCVDCFQLVQKGRCLGGDYHILETKYNNQRIRLLAWGRACGYVGENHSGGDCLPLQWSEEVESAVSETLQHIAALFQDHRRLSGRYGLSRSGPVAATVSLVAASSTLSSLTRRFHGRAATRSGSGVRAAAQWAIADKDKFAALVTHLKDFIDDLEGLTSDMGVARRQRHFIQIEVESIHEESELEAIEQARLGSRDPVADAASLRLSQFHSAGNASSIDPLEDVPAEWEVIQPVTTSFQPPTEPYRQVLYRVSCDLQQSEIFFDEPTYSSGADADGQWLVIDTERPLRAPSALHLSGRRPLHDLDSYLEQNTQLRWFAIKDYTCCHDTRGNRDTEPLTMSIRLISQKLCNDLNAFDPQHDFAPGRELKAPYDWLYHYCRNSLERIYKHSSLAERLLQFIEDDMAETYRTV